MLRTKVDPQPTLWEAILPPEFLALPPGLAQIDRLLDDPVFFEPFVAVLRPGVGRPSIPMETYLRMMFLRFRYRLGFETLCAEVTDSLAWRRFCRIAITDAVPHPTTLMKITTRCGDRAVDQLNEAAGRRRRRPTWSELDKVRADTTVVPANVAYPTDSGLLAKGVAKLTKTVRRHPAPRSGPAHPLSGPHPLGAPTGPSGRGLAAPAQRGRQRRGARPHRRAGHHRRGDHQRRPGRGPKRPPGAAPGRRGASGKATALVAELERTISVLEQIVAQTRTRLGGEVPDGSTRIVSLHDTDARPIAKGRLGKPGRIRLQGTGDGQHRRHRGRPLRRDGQPARCPDARGRHRPHQETFSKVPRAVTADRGYGEAKVENELHELGVQHVAIPRKGRPGAARQAVESARRFRKLVKWRTGSEGRISYLKHSWGWERTRIDGIDGARTWCGWGVLAHNATKIAVLIDEREQRNAPAPSPGQRPRTSAGPPGRSPPPPHAMLA